MSDVTNQETVDIANQILAELQQAARDGQLIQNDYYATEADGRAAVANGETFKVQGDGVIIACYLYRRVNATSSVLIASFPSSSYVDKLANDPLRPASSTTEQILVSVTDVNGRATWLSARAEDGGPTAESLELLATQLPVPTKRDVQSLLFALTDMHGRVTDLRVRASDGGIPDDVLKTWMERGAKYLNLAGGNGNYWRGGELLPADADMSVVATWGSSSMENWQPYLRDGVQNSAAGAV